MPIVPDVLEPGLKVVICGTGVGNKSAKDRAYYAGRGNKFWRILRDSGLTPRELEPKEFRELPSYGIGLTDLAKDRSGNDPDLTGSDYDVGNFLRKVKRHKPSAVAFNGKKAAKVFYHQRHVDYGKQAALIEQAIVFVLPSTSNSANGDWKEAYWFEFAEFLRDGPLTV